MARQQFSHPFRECLWEVHGKKCFYCTMTLPFVELQIDHVVPEYLHHGDASQRNSYLDEIGQPETFNILGRVNLAPSCVECNKKKRDLGLAPGATAIALARIAQKLPSLEEQLLVSKSVYEMRKLAMMVMRSAAKGKFDLADFKEELERLSPGKTDDGGVVKSPPPAQGPHIPIKTRNVPVLDTVQIPVEVPIREPAQEHYGYWTSDDAIRIINALLSGTGEVEVFTHPTGEVRYAIRDGEFMHIYAWYADGTPRLRYVDTM